MPRSASLGRSSFVSASRFAVFSRAATSDATRSGPAPSLRASSLHQSDYCRQNSQSAFGGRARSRARSHRLIFGLTDRLRVESRDSSNSAFLPWLSIPFSTNSPLHPSRKRRASSASAELRLTSTQHERSHFSSHHTRWQLSPVRSSRHLSARAAPARSSAHYSPA